MESPPANSGSTTDDALLALARLLVERADEILRRDHPAL
jgi:hypothetical protein